MRSKPILSDPSGTVAMLNFLGGALVLLGVLGAIALAFLGLRDEKNHNWFLVGWAIGELATTLLLAFGAYALASIADNVSAIARHTEYQTDLMESEKSAPTASSSTSS